MATLEQLRAGGYGLGNSNSDNSEVAQQIIDSADANISSYEERFRKSEKIFLAMKEYLEKEHLKAKV